MNLALCATSHSPLMEMNPPSEAVSARVSEALHKARSFVENFSPDLVVVFAPDHYNGFFYNVMPPFCIGTAAYSVGDYGMPSGPLPVDGGVATTVRHAVLGAGIDIAVSERMAVDHGFVQPLKLLFGSIDSVPIVPVFINCVALPLGPVRRARLLGEAVMNGLDGLDRRILLLASGGLSHDPPVPTFDSASPEVREGLAVGRKPTIAEREARESRTLNTARQFASGMMSLKPLNPSWDATVLEKLASGEVEHFDDWSPEYFQTEAGGSSHEVRTWIAAYASLGARGPYEVRSSFYEPIPEWIAGFAVTTAVPI